MVSIILAVVKPTQLNSYIGPVVKTTHLITYLLTTLAFPSGLHFPIRINI